MKPITVVRVVKTVMKRREGLEANSIKERDQQVRECPLIMVPG